MANRKPKSAASMDWDRCLLMLDGKLGRWPLKNSLQFWVIWKTFKLGHD